MNDFEQTPPIQNDAPQPSFDSTTIQKNDINGWSWGAFMFDFIFIIATKKYIYLLLFLLYLIPLVNFLAMIGIRIFLGTQGRRIAAESQMFSNKDEWQGFMKALDHAGYIIFIVTVIVLILGFVLMAVFLPSPSLYLPSPSM